MKSTDIFFDTDCLSSFLWVGREDIFLTLYKNLVIIPDEVYFELAKVDFLKIKIDYLIKKNKVKLKSIFFGTKEYELYSSMIHNPNKDITNMIIGNGEAAAIALCITNNGILASNNLKDIAPYVNYYSIKSILTEDILIEALHKNIITEKDGNEIWLNMLKKKRKLPYRTFSECVRVKYKRDLNI